MVIVLALFIEAGHESSDSFRLSLSDWGWEQLVVMGWGPNLKASTLGVLEEGSRLNGMA